MTTRTQKRKIIAELVSGDFEFFVPENSPSKNLVASSRKVPRVEPESLVEIKTSPTLSVLAPPATATAYLYLILIRTEHLRSGW